MNNNVTVVIDKGLFLTKKYTSPHLFYASFFSGEHSENNKCFAVGETSRRFLILMNVGKNVYVKIEEYLLIL